MQQEQRNTCEGLDLNWSSAFFIVMGTGGIRTVFRNSSKNTK